MRVSRTTEEGKFAKKVLRDLERGGDLSPQAAARLGLTFLAVVKRDEWSRVRRAAEKEDTLQVADALKLASDAAGLPFDLPLDSGAPGRLKPDALRKVVSAFDRITPWQVESIRAVAEIFAVNAFEDPQTPPAVAGLVAEIARPPAGATLFDPAVQAGMILLRAALRADSLPVTVHGWSYSDDGDDDAWKVTWLILKASGIENVKIDPAAPKYADYFMPAPWGEVMFADLTRVPVSRARNESGPVVQAILSHLEGGGPLVLLAPGNLLADPKNAELCASLMRSNLMGVMRLPVSLFPRGMHDVDLLVVRGGSEPCLEREILFLDVAAYLAADPSRSLNDETSRMIGETYRAFLEKDPLWQMGAVARFGRAVRFQEVREKQMTMPGSGLEVALYVPPVVEPVDLKEAFERLKNIRRERQKIAEDLEQKIDTLMRTIRL